MLAPHSARRDATRIMINDAAPSKQRLRRSSDSDTPERQVEEGHVHALHRVRSSSHAQRVRRLDPVEIGDEAELHHPMLGAVLIAGVDRALSAEPWVSAEEQPIFDVVHLILNVEVSERGAGVIALQLVETNLQGGIIRLLVL